jgi:ubiquinone/menaquinone biosynthesis C-methylase UbiE
MNVVEKPTHSSYESYGETAKAYDITRVPVGLSILIERFNTSGLALAHQRLLDLGCGTGNYLDALKEIVGLLVGLDGSQEMLRRAAQKCAGYSNIELKHGSILELPFQDQLFDGVMINQVLHHLSGSSGFQQYRQCLAEVFRVLKSGGVLCINTCSQEQLKLEGPFWYLQVFPEAARYMAPKYAPIGDLLGILRSVGFTDPVVQTHPDERFFTKEQYYDVEGPFQKEWRDGDSAFAVYRDQGEMLEARLQELKRKIHDHSISEIIEKPERIREKLGQYVVISARRP